MSDIPSTSSINSIKLELTKLFDLIKETQTERYCLEDALKLELLKTTTMEIKNISVPTQTPPAQHLIRGKDRIKEHFNGIRSMQMLIQAGKGNLVFDEENNLIYCKKCASINISSYCTGKFKCFFSLKEDFSVIKVLPIEFRNLKNNIMGQLQSDRHQKCLNLHDPRDSLTFSISTAVLRTVYHTISQSHSHEEYTRLLMLQHLNGVNVGNICHSSRQMVQFRDIFADVVLDSIKKFCNNAPCISNVADKVTLNHQTVDIIAIHGIEPEAPKGIIQCYAGWAPLVKQHDGRSLAENWKIVLERMGIHKSSQVAAIGTDGQYHHGNVPKIFLKLLDENEDTACIRSVWDGGHLVELAMNQTITESGHIQDIVKTILTVSKYFRQDKSLSEAKESADKFSQPILWSQTRWVARFIKCNY